MSVVTTIGLDIAKHVFHAHGADAAGRAVFSRRLTRGKLLDFFAAHPRCVVALEACGGAHHARQEAAHAGHGRARQQNGAHRLGGAGQTGRLQGSGRSRGVS